jgi:hypothetical protein
MSACRSITAAIAIWAISVSPAGAAPVTDCGQVVEGAGLLAADLDCSTYTDGPAVVLMDGSLSLGGHQLTGNAAQPAILCNGRCIVRGPGSVVGGQNSVRASRCDLRSVSFDGAAADSVYCSGADIRKSSISGAGGNGVYATTLRISRSTIRGSAEHGADVQTGLRASRVDVRDNGGAGLLLFIPTPDQKIHIKASVVENNGNSGFGIYQSYEPVRIVNSIFRGNRVGIWGNTSFDVRGSEITGHDIAGIYIGETLEISDSVVTGNCLDWVPEDWDGCCSDIHAESGVEARKVTCGTSEGGPGTGCGTYGVCSMD